MRELKEEIKSIPKCCCDVSVSGFEDIEYNFSIVYCQCGGLISAVPVDDAEPFDITKHEWSDDALCFGCVDCEGDIEISCTDTDGEFYLAKHDAIAIAKHFGLTNEDLI